MVGHHCSCDPAHRVPSRCGRGREIGVASGSKDRGTSQPAGWLGSERVGAGDPHARRGSGHPSRHSTKQPLYRGLTDGGQALNLLGILRNRSSRPCRPPMRVVVASARPIDRSKQQTWCPSEPGFYKTIMEEACCVGPDRPTRRHSSSASAQHQILVLVRQESPDREPRRAGRAPRSAV